MWRDQEVARLFRENRWGGRPSKLTEAVIRDAEVLARIGLTKAAICDSLGIALQTLDNWIMNSPEFALRIQRARNKGKSVLVNSIFGAGRKNWQAHAWLLERQYRNEFAISKTQLELTGKDNTPLIPTTPTKVIIDFSGE